MLMLVLNLWIILVVNDLSSVEQVASISVFCSPTQLSSLTYVDVRVKSDRNDPGLVIKALSDTGAQISVLKAEMLGDRQLESLGKIQLQPFCGNLIEADWVKLSVAPVRMNDQSGDNSDVVIECAVVSNFNESMILTADVIAHLSHNEQNQPRDDVSSDDVVVPIFVGTVVESNAESPVDVIDDNDQNTESASNDDDDDDVVTDTDLASRDEIAREQR